MPVGCDESTLAAYHIVVGSLVAVLEVFFRVAAVAEMAAHLEVLVVLLFSTLYVGSKPVPPGNAKPHLLVVIAAGTAKVPLVGPIVLAPLTRFRLASASASVSV